MESFCKQFNDLTKAPDGFLSPGLLTGDLKGLLKNVYDFCQNHERTSDKALPELIVKDFDDEQIWQELELQNEDSLPNLINKVARLVTSRNLDFLVKTGKDTLSSDVDNLKSDGGKKKTGDKKTKRSEAISSEEESGDDLDLEDNDEFSKDEIDSDEEKELQPKSKGIKIVPSEVDDNFFKLSEAEAFLKDQEENEKDLGIDLFDGVESGSDEEERPLYNDFFEEQNPDEDRNYVENYVEENDEGEQSDENDDDKEFGKIFDVKSDEKGKKKVSFDIDSDEGEEKDLENEGNSNSSDEEMVKSSYEMREEKLRSKIAKLEDKSLEEKPWTLKGEVSADVRPVNSLLEEVVEFDMNRRPAPIVTEETSNRLEDIIIKRIKDRAFSDVVRKHKPVETPNEFKKKLVLDQEKSKLSLAEVYEKEFLKKKDDKNQDVDEPEKEPEEHRIISSMMKSLFIKLDALTNFFFVPKPVAPDLKIVNNLPAIDIEEVAPVATSDAKLLAPEEIGGTFRKSLVAREEKSKTDKKRERRKKKAHQAKMFERKKAKENTEKRSNYQDELKKVLKFRNVSKLDETSGNTKSSTDFFNKLQSEVGKPQGSNSKKRKFQHTSKTAKKFKL